VKIKLPTIVTPAIPNLDGQGSQSRCYYCTIDLFPPLWEISKKKRWNAYLNLLTAGERRRKAKRMYQLELKCQL
jgi:hypothetical protein